MRTRTKIVLGAATSLFVLTVGGWLPTYIKQRIEQEVPGAAPGTIEMRFWRVEIWNTRISRPGLWADLPHIIVRMDGSIFLDGGDINVKKNEGGEAKTGTPERKISFQGLHITTDWHGIPVDLLDATGTLGGPVSIEHAIIEQPFATISAERVRMTKGLESNTIRAESVSIHDFKPLPLDPCQHIELTKVEVSPGTRHVEAETVLCGGNRIDGFQARWTDESVEVRAATAIVSHPWLHVAPLVFSREIHADWDGEIGTVTVGGVVLAVNLAAKRLDIRGACNEIKAGLPFGLAEPLDDVIFSGDLDIRVLWGSNPDVAIKGRCKAACSSPKLAALRRPFTYRPYTSTGERKERQSGPGSREWVPLPGEPIVSAVIAMEDPGFFAHQGFIPQAFRNSLKANLDAGRFVRGGSTITMQLAKNLWLSRDKTFGRKVQELLLASALESCYGKDAILELYLNVVEFGPDLYGIGPAAQHWFHRTPAELSPQQAFWLASILPNPRKAVQPDEATLARTEKLIRKLVETGRVPDTMLEQLPEGALDEW